MFRSSEELSKVLDPRAKRFLSAFAATAMLASTILIAPVSLADNAVRQDDPAVIKTQETDTEIGEPAVRKDGKLVRKADEAAEQLAQTQALDHFDLARFYMSQFDFKMSELELEAAIMYMPLMKAAHRDYCVVSLLRGHPMRALAELMMVIGMGEPIPLSDGEKVELKARGAKLHYRKALDYGKKGKWDNAIAELKWALDFTPTNAAIKRSLAFALASKGEFDLAEDTYKDSLAADPGDPYAHADFAYLLSDKGDQGEAFSQLAQAVKLAPQAAALHVDLAWMAETKGDFKLASDELEKAIKISPTHAGLWAHLGRVDERKGDVDGAIAAYNRALNVDPGQFEAKRRLEVIKAEEAKTKSVAPDVTQEGGEGKGGKAESEQGAEKVKSGILSPHVKTSSKPGKKTL
jgi:tetratricopeptide (TPR) repeat protein